VELGVGAERHTAPGRHLTPAHEALPGTWFFIGSGAERVAPVPRRDG